MERYAICAILAAANLQEDCLTKELGLSPGASTKVRRLLYLAAVRDGKDRSEAAKIGGMDGGRCVDWVHCFNAGGPEAFFDNWTNGPKVATIARATGRVRQNRRSRPGSRERQRCAN